MEKHCKEISAGNEANLRLIDCVPIPACIAPVI